MLLFIHTTTINISLPVQLKFQADNLIKQGYFASFSDLARTALRQIIHQSGYDIMAKEAIEEHKQGESTVLKTKKDVKKYIKEISSNSSGKPKTPIFKTSQTIGN